MRKQLTPNEQRLQFAVTYVRSQAAELVLDLKADHLVPKEDVIEMIETQSQMLQSLMDGFLEL